MLSVTIGSHMSRVAFADIPTSQSRANSIIADFYDFDLQKLISFIAFIISTSLLNLGTIFVDCIQMLTANLSCPLQNQICLTL